MVGYIFYQYYCHCCYWYSRQGFTHHINVIAEMDNMAWGGDSSEEAVGMPGGLQKTFQFVSSLGLQVWYDGDRREAEEEEEKKLGVSALRFPRLTSNQVWYIHRKVDGKKLLPVCLWRTLPIRVPPQNCSPQMIQTWDPHGVIWTDLLRTKKKRRPSSMSNRHPRPQAFVCPWQRMSRCAKNNCPPGRF